MKYFPLKILLFLVVMTVVAHFATVSLLERYLEYTYTRGIENIYIGDTTPLFEGRLSLSENISRNIDGFLLRKSLILTGASVDVRVTSGGAVWVYPQPLDLNADRLAPPSAAEVAAENFRLMNQGLSVSVRILLGWNALLVVVIFIFYILLAAGIFAYFYVSGARRAKRDEKEKQQEIDRLRELERHHEQRAEALAREKKQLSLDIAETRKNLLEYKDNAGRMEDAMIDEIIALEEKIRKNMELAEALRHENEALKEVTGRYEDEKKRGSRKSALYGNVEKRFKALYKNIVFHKRALEGFMDLTDDMKIKAEEVVRQIDADPAAANIKRKVDLRKSREKIFEAMFAYNGRLYFRNTRDGKVEILAIGNKNTQVKDMTFLDTF
ncbi:MAG: hypothetical protein AB1724_20060 [Thermodesulfobacteriota bacterium]